ncbi:MAG: CDP-alcohol phosphatidyltransferase family protein [Candidatus Acidiferrales bacterium]
MNSRIFTVPNQLTFLRLGFLPFFIIAIHYGHFEWALAILIVAGLSDGLDGLLARGLNQKTPLGAYLDPLADKLLLSSSYFVLALEGKIPWWVAILVLSRDVLLLAASAAILVTVGYRPLPPSIWGKLTTTFEITLILDVILIQLFSAHWLRVVRHFGVFVVAFLVVFTGVHYSIVVSRRLHAGG